MFRSTILTMIAAAALLSGCASTYQKAPAALSSQISPASSQMQSSPEASGSSQMQSSQEASGASQMQSSPTDADDLVEYQGIYKKRSEVSADTIRWLDWYHTLPEDQQDALNFVPSEFCQDLFGEVATMETASESPAYLASLTDDELTETAELARYYFTELNPVFGGVEQLTPADDTFALYHNIGLENEYTPGNIIIYQVETAKDKKEGNPMRSISIARRSKADKWKVINSGF